MNEYEIEYYVKILEKRNIKIDEENLLIANKIRSKIIKKAILFHIILSLLVVIICFVFIKNYYIIMLSMILLIFFQKRIVDNIYNIIINKKYSKNLSKDFLERIKNEY